MPRPKIMKKMQSIFKEDEDSEDDVRFSTSSDEDKK